MRFDFHCHTKEGSLDGKIAVAEYIEILKNKGFQGMLVTDHDSYNGYRKYRDTIKKDLKDFVVLKGIEYDTIDAGHILVIMPENTKLLILECRGLPVRLLQDISSKNTHREHGLSRELETLTEKLCADLHCSKVMSDSLRQHIRYQALMGTDVVSVIAHIYEEGMLPCKDKREGKLRFEELKRRLF